MKAVCDTNTASSDGGGFLVPGEARCLGDQGCPQGLSAEPGAFSLMPTVSRMPCNRVEYGLISTIASLGYPIRQNISNGTRNENYPSSALADSRLSDTLLWCR